MSFKKFIEQVDEVIKFALEKLNLPGETYSLIEPTKEEFGDLSCNIAFLLIKKLKKSPYEIASMLIDQYIHNFDEKKRLESTSYVKSAVAHESGYINFKANFDLIGKEILNEILQNDFSYLNIGNGKKVIVEHTSVNPNKALHVGHLRNVAIGDTLYRLLKKTNHNVTVLNYVDDSGMQVADILVGFLYLKFPIIPEDKNMKFDEYCGNEIYVKVNALYEKDPSLREKRKTLLKKLESGDDEFSSFASEITLKVLNDQLKTCWRLKAHYDLLNFESHILNSDLWKNTFQKLRDQRIIKKETEGKNIGCWIFESVDEGIKIIVRSDNTATYIAKDIPYALLKIGTIQDPFKYKVFTNQWDDSDLWITTNDHLENETHPIFFPGENSITVIDSRQTRLQKIIKEVLNKITEKSNEYLHLAYGPVLLSSRTANMLGVNAENNNKSMQMSGRKGIYVDADYVLDTLHSKAKEEIIKRNPEIAGDDLEGTSEEIAISAMRYSLIKNDLEKEIKFDMIDSLSLEGNSGPYLQYAYARCCRLIEKSQIESFDCNAINLSQDIEYRLIKHLSKFSIVLEDTIRNMEPKLIAQYAYDLATIFNLFYEKLPILKEKNVDISNTRISLVEAIRLMLEMNLSLIGITPLKRM